MIGRRRQPKPAGPVPTVLPQIIAEVVSAEHVVLTVNGKRLPATPTRRDEPLRPGLTGRLFAVPGRRCWQCRFARLNPREAAG